MSYRYPSRVICITFKNLYVIYLDFCTADSELLWQIHCCLTHLLICVSKTDAKQLPISCGQRVCF